MSSDLGPALNTVRTLAGSSRVTDQETDSLDFLLHTIESWKQEEKTWARERKEMQKELREAREVLREAKLLAELWLRRDELHPRILGADLKQVLDGV